MSRIKLLALPDLEIRMHPFPLWLPFQLPKFVFNVFNRFMQVPDAVVTDRRLASYDAEADPENPGNLATPQSMTRRDPFNFGHGLKTDSEIAELRTRKRGKRLANYHRKQNAVGVSSTFIHVPYSHCVYQLITSLLKPMEEHTEDARNEDDLSRIPVSACTSC
jgi:hypothetical protein